MRRGVFAGDGLMRWDTRVKMRGMGHREIFRFSTEHAYRISEDRNVYLDTGVVRRRASTLRATPLATAAYTSSLTLIELLAELRSSDRQFALRRAPLRAIFDADIQVDWQMADQKVLCAFPTLRPRVDVFEDRVAALRKLIHLAVSATDRSAFEAAVQHASLTEALVYFEKYDQAIDEQMRATGEALQKIGKSNYDPASPFRAALGLPENASHGKFVKAVQASVLNRIMTRGVFAYEACDFAGIDGKTDRASFRHFFEEYDGSLDPYLLGFGWWHMEHAIGRTSGRNDGLDVVHLRYLFPGAILATTDRDLAKLASAVEIPVYGPHSRLLDA
jgi:hypothetical protein